MIADSGHPWAFLRDRLEPRLAAVRWARPGGAEVGAAVRSLWPWPWAVAADGPGGLPASRLPCATLRFDAAGLGGWPATAAELNAVLGRPLAGVRLAPSRGLALPDGRLASYVPELEALLGAGGEGLVLGSRQRRRAAEQLAKLGWSGLRLVDHGGRLALEAGDVDAA